MISLDRFAPRVRVSQATKKTAETRNIMDSATDFIDLKMSKTLISDLKKVLYIKNRRR